MMRGIRSIRPGWPSTIICAPSDEQGRCLYPNLFAAGSILAHQDWIRQKCGSGLAIASAYAAVRASKTVLGQNPQATMA